MSDFSFWDLILSMFWFMLLLSWIWLVISIFGDLFRDHDLSGGAKALWTAFLIFVPWVGALVYLIARGGSMNQRSMQAARDRDEQMRSYVKDVAGTTSTADELRKLSQL